MHRNIFIYLVLAIAIAACRGGATERSIRVKRIAESDKSKKSNEKPGTIEETRKVPATQTDKLLKGTALGTETALKGQTVKAESNVVEDHFEGRNHSEHAKRGARNIGNLGKVNVKERRLMSESKGGHGDDTVQLKEEENLRMDIVDEKVPERGLSDSMQKKMGDSKIYEPSHHREGSGAGGGGRRRRFEHASMGTKTGLVAVVERTKNSDMSHHQLEHSLGTEKYDDLREGSMTKRNDARTLSKKKDGKMTILSATTSTVNENNPSTRSTINSHTHEEDDTIQKLIDDVKTDRHGRNEKPDVDVYLYSNTPEFYKPPLPILFETFNAKEFKSPSVVTLESFEHFLPELRPPPPPVPYKWLQSRSAMQNAIDVVNMMVKVGLDEMESDEDYEVHGPSFIFGNGGNHKFERGFTADANFCPFHRAGMIAFGVDGFKDDAPRSRECSCSLKRNAQELQRNTSGLDDLDGTKRNKERNTGGEGFHEGKQFESKSKA